jgi:hypothetical protein
MRQKTKKVGNQGSNDKKMHFLVQSLSHIPRWFRLVQKTRAKNSHAWAPLRILYIKHAEKMVKICQKGLPKLNFETRPKKIHFPVFAKNFRRPLMKLKFFFANFQSLGPLGCQGWVVIPQNVKKVKITAP